MNMRSSGKAKCWRSHWVWADNDGREENACYYFRTTFERAEPCAEVRVDVTADTRYQLFVNGQEVARGPAMSQPYYQFYDTHYVAQPLLAGVNTIAVIVQHLGTIPDTRGGLLLEVTDAASGDLLSATERWRVQRARAWKQRTYAYRGNRGCPFQEVQDARAVPVGWMDADFDDSSWPRAVVVGDAHSDRPPAVKPWTRLVPRQIPAMRLLSEKPRAVVTAEENLDLENRSRPEDLSPTLSQAGRPLQYARMDYPEHFCVGKPVVVCCSTRHLQDYEFDGIYCPSVVLDFGKIITARVRIDLEGHDGAMVDVGYVERLVDGHFNNALEGEFADRYIMRNGRQCYESFAWKAFRYIKLRFRKCYKPVTVCSLEAVCTSYPFEDNGSFECSDSTLQQIFEISRYTLRLCSHECIMDTPWREQAQWLGDVARISVPAIQSCFGDPRLSRQFFLQSGANQHSTGFIANISNTVSPDWQQVIPDFSLWWVQGLWLHYFYTGDIDLLHYLYPQAVRVLLAHLDYVNDQGLLEDMPYWVFIDWADLERRGVSAAYNAIFYQTLDSWEQMARLKQDGAVLQEIHRLRAGIQARFHDTLYDPESGLYCDAAIDARRSPKRSEQSNMAAIWAGLCPAGRAGGVIDRLFGPERPSGVVEAQPFFMSVVLQALAAQERIELALDLIRRRWGQRMVAHGATSTCEEWWSNGSRRNGGFEGFLRSCSHAWSAFPADFLIRNLMGLHILDAGCGRVRVNPYRAGFDYSLQFPVPCGAVSVHWRAGQLTVETSGSVQVLVD